MTTIHLGCKGRDAQRREVFEIPIFVAVQISSDKDAIYLKVDCPHNTGGHGQRCKASHPGKDKVGQGILCSFAVDLPYAMDRAKF